MAEYYVPGQGPSFETWLDSEDPIGARDREQDLHLSIIGVTDGVCGIAGAHSGLPISLARGPALDERGNGA
jgi:hypothetical protein